MGFKFGNFPQIHHEDFIEYDIPKNLKKIDVLKPLMIKAKAVGKNKRGEKTVNELTGINDKEVMSERTDKLKNYRVFYEILLNNNGKVKDIIYKHIKDDIKPSSEFAGMARYYFNGPGKSLFFD